MVLLTACGLLALSLVIPPLSGGGWMWLLPSVMVPLVVSWVVVEGLMFAVPGRLRLRERRGTVVGIVLATAIAVAGFYAVVAVAFQH